MAVSTVCDQAVARRYTPSCDDGASPTGNGTAKCDFPSQVLQKFQSARLRRLAPAAYSMVGALNLGQHDMLELFTNFVFKYGNTTGEQRYWGTACDWVRPAPFPPAVALRLLLIALVAAIA